MLAKRMLRATATMDNPMVDALFCVSEESSLGELGVTGFEVSGAGAGAGGAGGSLQQLVDAFPKLTFAGQSPTIEQRAFSSRIAGAWHI